MYWGKGVNNDIGWGQGYTQSDWGSVYEDSWSGDTLLVSDEDETPINTVSPVITGISQVGQTLNCSTGTWSNNPTSYTYQWKRNNISITGETLSTYTLVSADANSSIKCTVTATNDDGFASADSDTVNVTWETDADAFITAAAITDPTQQSAVNQLVLDMKTANIWTKMKAVYPFVGGTATTHKWNLKDPRDLDAAFRLRFSGGFTHSANGVKGNGTNGFADTYLNTATVFPLKKISFGYYSRTSTPNNIGFNIANTNVSTYHYVSINYTLFQSGNISLDNTATNNWNGFIACSRRSSTDFFAIKRDGLFITNNTSDTTAFASLPLYLWGSNGGGAAKSNIEMAFSYISDDLTQSEITDLRTAVINFQTTLSRNV